MTREFSAGNYRFIPSVFQYSAGAAANQLVGKRMVEIMHGIGLHPSGVLPAVSEGGHPIHLRGRREAYLLAKAFRAEVAVAHGTLGIAPAPFARFGPAGDDEGRRRRLARARERKRVK